MTFVGFNVDSDIAIRPGMEKLVDQVDVMLKANPSLMSALYDGTLVISCPTPAGYKPGLYRWATELRGRMHRNGHLFEIPERIPGGGSGGWMASCIPPSMYAVFLRAWIAFAGQPRQVVVEPEPTATPHQMDLFTEEFA